VTANQPLSNYWIRANPSRGDTGFVGGINSAILKYINPRIINPVTPDPITAEVTSTNPMLETNLHPLSNPGAPGKPKLGDADVNLNLNIGINTSTGLFTMNNASFTPPTIPVLLQILSKAQNAQDLLPTGDVYVLPRNKVIEISIPGGSPGSPVSGSIIFIADNCF
jgi:iron transport multicopper oxidase